MRKTAEEARAAAVAAGYQGEPTPEVLRQFGWTPSDDAQAVLAVVLKDPARTPEQVRDDIALLHEEGKANNVPAMFLNMTMKVLGSAVKLIKPV